MDKVNKVYQYKGLSKQNMARKKADLRAEYFIGLTSTR